MKSQILPIKRRPVSTGMFRRLNAVTKGRRRQRVAAAGTARDMEFEENHSRIAWALTILLVIHVVAVCLIFIHHRFISSRPIESAAVAVQHEGELVQAAPADVPSPQVLESQLTAAEKPYIVRSGDTYASIAQLKDVAEADLRALNENIAMQTGLILKIPVKRVVVKAMPREESTLTPVAEALPEREEGLVAAIDTRHAPKAKPVADAVAGSHVVERGESVWGISQRYGVSQDELMQANGIKDARKLLVGMKLKIP